MLTLSNTQRAIRGHRPSSWSIRRNNLWCVCIQPLYVRIKMINMSCTVQWILLNLRKHTIKNNVADRGKTGHYFNEHTDNTGATLKWTERMDEYEYMFSYQDKSKLFKLYILYKNLLCFVFFFFILKNKLQFCMDYTGYTIHNIMTTTEWRVFSLHKSDS